MRIFLGLGSNVGERHDHLSNAVVRLASSTSVEIVGRSGIYETEAHTLPGSEPQAMYLNAAVEIATRLSPNSLLSLCKEIEREEGRMPRIDVGAGQRWAPRCLDIDILQYGELSMSSRQLVIPHPSITQRLFVLKPLLDLDPGLYLVYPFETKIADALRNCTDQGRIVRVGEL